MLGLNLYSVLLLAVFILGTLGDTPYYVIIPKLDNDPDQNSAIDSYINKKVDGSDKVFRCNSDNSEIGTLYWWAPLTNEAKADLQKDEGKHLRLIEDITILPGGADSRVISSSREIDQQLEQQLDRKLDRRLRKRDITSQKGDVPWHLRMVCQKPGLEFNKVDGYYYDDSAGSGKQIYIIDSGLRRSHKEFNDVHVEWMHAGPFASPEENDAAPDGHGTSMASVALGVHSGIAKRSSLTVVRADRYREGGKKLSPLIWLDALKQVYDNVKALRKGNAVVNMSWGFADSVDRDSQRIKDLNNALKDLYTKVLKPLIADLDTPAFVSAGNDAARNQDVDAIPAVLAGSTLPDLIVIGGVDEDGSRSPFSQTADFVKLYAPADEIVSASSKDDVAYSQGDGTSAASAMTAGLAAYFMGLKNSGSDSRQKLFDLSYPRRKNGPKVFWNEIDTTAVSGISASSSTNNPEPAPQNVDGGIVQCKAQDDDGDIKYYFNREGAIDAFGTFCKNQHENKVIIGGAGGVAIQSQAMRDGKETPLLVSMKATAGDDLIPLDFDHDGPGSESTCNYRFTTLLETCDPIKRTSDSWKQGGTYTLDGITYKLVAAGQ